MPRIIATIAATEPAVRSLRLPPIYVSTAIMGKTPSTEPSKYGLYGILSVPNTIEPISPGTTTTALVIYDAKRLLLWLKRTKRFALGNFRIISEKWEIFEEDF